MIEQEIIESLSKEMQESMDITLLADMGVIYAAKMPEAYATVEWCKQTFGESGTWWRSKGYLCFKNQQEYLWYQLRWA